MKVRKNFFHPMYEVTDLTTVECLGSKSRTFSDSQQINPASKTFSEILQFLQIMRLL
jgi:hypothetical protein